MPQSKQSIAMKNHWSKLSRSERSKEMSRRAKLQWSRKSKEEKLARNLLMRNAQKKSI